MHYVKITGDYATRYILHLILTELLIPLIFCISPIFNGFDVCCEIWETAADYNSTFNWLPA